MKNKINWQKLTQNFGRKSVNTFNKEWASLWSFVFIAGETANTSKNKYSNCTINNVDKSNDNILILISIHTSSSCDLWFYIKL